MKNLPEFINTVLVQNIFWRILKIKKEGLNLDLCQWSHILPCICKEIVQRVCKVRRRYPYPYIIAWMNFLVIHLPAGKDPDELIRNEPDAWRSATDNAKPFLEYVLDRVRTTMNLTAVEGKKQAAKLVYELFGV